MKSHYIDAVVEFVHLDQKRPRSVLLCFDDTQSSARFDYYDAPEGAEENFVFIQAYLSCPLSLKWKDAFQCKSPQGEKVWGRGRVLDPFSQKTTGRRKKRRLTFLRQLTGEEKDMLLALARFKGTKGLREKDVLCFCRLSNSRLRRLSEELEAEAKVKILSFFPLFLVSQSSFEFLCDKITAYLSRFHENHPDERGVSRKKIQKRFDLPPKIFSLVLKYLSQHGRLRETGDLLALSDVERALLPEEEHILKQLEDMCLKGEFQSVSLETLRKSFRLSSKRLHKMLSLLVERRKIVQGKDGYILHSRWLDEIITKMRGLKKKELTIAEFKELTGLSRKYAIPLLELLDQLGVTKRKGNIREIQ